MIIQSPWCPSWAQTDIPAQGNIVMLYTGLDTNQLSTPAYRQDGK